MDDGTGNRETYVIDGVAYVLPRFEGRPRWARRVGQFGVGISWRWTSFNLGVDLLRAGILIAIGPAFFWIAHIERQTAAFDAQ